MDARGSCRRRSRRRRRSSLAAWRRTGLDGIEAVACVPFGATQGEPGAFARRVAERLGPELRRLRWLLGLRLRLGSAPLEKALGVVTASVNLEGIHVVDLDARRAVGVGEGVGLAAPGS